MRRVTWLSRLGAVGLAAMLVITGAGPLPLQGAGSWAYCRTVADNLSLRDGPGTAFAAVGVLSKDTQVRGMAFVKTGVPKGSWIEVEVMAGLPTAFLPADKQSVKCEPAPEMLPAQKAPPAPAGTRVADSRSKTDGGDVPNPIIRGPVNVNNGQYILLPGFDPARVEAVKRLNGERVRFGDAVGFGVEVADIRVKRANDDGIKRVKFQVDDLNQGVTVYYTEEENKPYCLFSDENDRCNVYRFSQMGYKWPDTRFFKGLPASTRETPYRVTITIVADNGDEVEWFWFFDHAGVTVELR